MKNFFAKYQNSDLWCIKEDGFREDLQNIRETQFTLGNGLIGSRGVLEEKPKGALPGTYFAGIYDKLTAQVDELVNFPNPFYFKITSFGQKVGLTAMDLISHQRLLSMKNGVLTRHSVYSDNKKRRYDYQSLRFLSMDNKNIGVMQIILTSLDADTEIEVQTSIDASVFNSGVVTEGNKHHFSVKELSHDKNVDFLLVQTLEKKYYVLYRAGFSYKIGKKRKVYASDNVFTLKLNKGERVVFTKFFYIDFCKPGDLAKKKKSSSRVFNKFFKGNFHYFISQHINAWTKLWEKADIVIEGTADIQKNVRFNIYHLLLCVHYDSGFSSIGARTLSGEGYRGHIFWDTDIFLLPFYAHLFPEVAKNILLYRYQRLEQARNIAQAKGYKGALFPWESAADGNEETPTWAKNLDGSIIKIKTNEFEQHISADIAFACCKYWQITADKDFMHNYGYEIIFECARFWASRVNKNKEGKYQIKAVMGPDEFHDKVNNNAYTNIMAKWNLVVAARFYRVLKTNKKVYARLKNKLHLTEAEVKTWRHIAAKLGVKMRKDRVIEQFDGFFRKRYIEIVNFDENNIPLLPKEVDVADYNKTQFVKQADVIMALYLFSGLYSYRVKESNFWFYLRRTLHKSSLSAPMHALMATEIRALSRAYQFFNVALRADISDLHSNSDEGIHAASVGGVWQCVVYGFAGIKINNGVLTINPCMPLAWDSVKLSLFFKGNWFNLKVTNTEVSVKITSKIRRKVTLKIFDVTHRVAVGKLAVFHTGEPPSKLSLAERYY